MRGDLGKRSEDEEALMETRMREAKSGRVEDEVVAEEEIEIQEARPLGRNIGGADASEQGLDAQEFGQQRWRIERRREGGGGVEEPGLASDITRFGFIERGAGGDGSKGAQVGEGGAQVGRAITEIGAERDVCGVSHRCDFSSLRSASQGRRANSKCRF